VAFLDLGKFRKRFFSRGFGFGSIETHWSFSRHKDFFPPPLEFRSFLNPIKLSVVIIGRGLKRRLSITHFIGGEVQFTFPGGLKLANVTVTP